MFHIGIAVLVLMIGIILLFIFNKNAIKKYNFAFFTVASFIGAAISLGLIWVGYNGTIKATPNSDDVMNGIGMLVIGAIVALFLVFSHRSKTSLFSAVSAIFIQFSILGALAFLVMYFI